LIPERWLNLRLIKVRCQCRHERKYDEGFHSAKMVLPGRRRLAFTGHGDRLTFSFDPARAHLFHPDGGTAFGAAWWTLKGQQEPTMGRSE
jgi:hypothetical protein